MNAVDDPSNPQKKPAHKNGTGFLCSITMCINTPGSALLRVHRQ